MDNSEANGLEGLYRAQGPNLWRAIVAYSGDPEIASDAVAEAFAQAIRRGDALLQPERWIWKVAFRVAAGALKGRSSASELPSGSYELPEDAFLMTSLLCRLPTKQRAALVLHYYADLPGQQIAEILGITVATVHVHLSQGRRRLRQLLEDTDD